MNLSLTWLKDFVDIPRSLKPEELGILLTKHIVEVDGVQREADKYNNVVVGKILEIKKHPNADKLQLVTVDHKNVITEVVCGAFNIKPGQKVPLALPGAKLPNGMEIKEVEVRGVKSGGMLCAEDELGLGDDHAGIFILDDSAKIGDSLAKYLKLEDVVIEVDNKSITHRPDLWGHYGMAREIAAMIKKKLAPYPSVDPAKLQVGVTRKLNVKVSDYKLCPRYMALALEGVKIEPSPRWMQRKLIAVGMRPINNIVDITNYIMIELGQPMHAFDAAKINDIVVRRAAKGEQFETLDGQVRDLDEDMLLIADSGKPIAIAGIMGGANSEISPDTSSIILESANFNFASIRKTSHKLGLRTEASIRFEKALDPNLCETALWRAAVLITEVCPGAKIASLAADEKDASTWNLSSGPIELDMNWLHKFIGHPLREKKAIEILTALGFKVEKSDKKMSVFIPTWRATKDISIKEDLAEEIARHYGYDKLETNTPKVSMKIPEANKERAHDKKIKTLLAYGAGLTEVENYTFVGEEQLKKLGIDCTKHIRLANPINSQETMLRQSLAPNLIEAVKVNQSRFDEIGIFEIGSIFMNIEGELEKGDGTGDKLPYQENRLGIALAGGQSADIFLRLKGLIRYLADNYGLLPVFNPLETVPDWADVKMSAKIVILDRLIGFIYKIDQEAAVRTGLKKTTFIAEISLKELYKFIVDKGVLKFQEFEKYPPVIRDLAFILPEKTAYNEIRNEIISFDPMIKRADLFDVYQGENLGKNHKSLAFRIIYQSDRTLTAKEVDEIQEGLIKKLEEKFEAKIRNF